MIDRSPLFGARRLGALAVGLGLLGPGLSTPAHALEGLEWNWPEDLVRRYKIEGKLTLPEATRFDAKENFNGWVLRVDLAVVIDCKPTATLGKRGWELRCDILEAAVSALPMQEAIGQLTPVAQEWAASLEEGWLQVVLTRDGKVRSVDLEGVDKRIRRMQDIQETQRLLLTRLMAAFDLELPKKGDDEDRGGWSSNQSLAFALPTNEGTLGGVSVDVTVDKQLQHLVTLGIAGEGTVGSGTDATGSSNPRILLSGQLKGEAVFDTQGGALVSNRYFMKARPTASSQQAAVGAGFDYEQAVVLTALPAGGRVPDLGESRELPQPDGAAQRATPPKPPEAQPGNAEPTP